MTSGQRSLAFGVDLTPSVIESPSVTTAPTVCMSVSSTPSSQYQRLAVVVNAAADSSAE